MVQGTGYRVQGRTRMVYEAGVVPSVSDFCDEMAISLSSAAEHVRARVRVMGEGDGEGKGEGDGDGRGLLGDLACLDLTRLDLT